MINQNSVLMAVLECGTDDLSILDDIGYDLGDIVEELIAGGIRPTLNAITGEVFRRGVEELTQRINDRLCEPEDGDNDEVKAELRILNPKKDINWFCNCLDTHVYFVKNEEIYREYLPEAIKDIEDNMGFSF